MYLVVDADEIPEQLTALPDEVLPVYADIRALLEVTPWTGDPYHRDKPYGPMRTAVLGPSGAVVYLILEELRAVHVLLVQWVG